MKEEKQGISGCIKIPPDLSNPKNLTPETAKRLIDWINDPEYTPSELDKYSAFQLTFENKTKR